MADDITARLEGVSESLRQNGRFSISGFAPEQWQDVLEALAPKLGEAVSSPKWGTIMDVKPQDGFEPASSGGTGEFPLHTDLAWRPNPPKYIAMFCIHPGEKDSGESVLSDGLAAFDVLSEEEREALQALDVIFPAPDHIPSGGGYTGPVIKRDGDVLRVRFNEKCLQGSDSPSLRSYHGAVRDGAEVVTAEAGTLTVYCNDWFLHGRKAIKTGLDSQRWHKRMQIREVSGP